jgi:hypothetical protein
MSRNREAVAVLDQSEEFSLQPSARALFERQCPAFIFRCVETIRSRITAVFRKLSVIFGKDPAKATLYRDVALGIPVIMSKMCSCESKG